MHTELDREKCLWGLELVSKITSKNLTLPVLQCVLISVEKNIVNFQTTNLELGIKVDLEGKSEKDGVAAVPATLLLNTLQILSEKSVTLKVDEGVLVVKTKTSHTKINTVPHSDFPNLPNITTKPQTTNHTSFSLGIKTAAFATSQSTIKPELGSVYVSQQKEHTLTFVATDSFRLVEKTVPQEKVVLEAGILIPQRNALEIARVMEVVGEDPEFMVDENQIAFRFDSGVYITSRLTEGSFPDYKQIIPKEYETHATVLTSDLIQALKKTSLFVNKFMQVGFSVSEKGSLTLKAESGESGETEETIHATVDGEDLTLSFNQRYVNEPLSFVGGDSLMLHFAGVGRPMVLESTSEKTFRYLVMPMNK